MSTFHLLSRESGGAVNEVVLPVACMLSICCLCVRLALVVCKLRVTLWSAAPVRCRQHPGLVCSPLGLRTFFFINQNV